MRYASPGPEISGVLAEAPSPMAAVSPDGHWVVLVSFDPHPPVAYLSRPHLGLGGVRVDPRIRGRRRTTPAIGFEVVAVDGGDGWIVETPDDASLGSPIWSPDSRRFAFTIDEVDRIAVYVADVATRTTWKVPDLEVSDVLCAGALGDDGPVRWTRDSSILLALRVPLARRGRPVVPAAFGPHVEESEGEVIPIAFPNLLHTDADADVFADVGTTELVQVDPNTGEAAAIGEPRMITSVRQSPDGRFVLVHTVRRPFSFQVPYELFPRVVEVWHSDGRLVRTVAELAGSATLQRRAVPAGPRFIRWDERSDATLVWAEALDGGADDSVDVAHRDRLMRLDLPDGSAEEILRLHQRCIGWWQLDGRGRLLVVEHDRRAGRRRAWHVSPDATATQVFEHRDQDSYDDPGSPLETVHADGARTLTHAGPNEVYFARAGAGPSGLRPCLDVVDVVTGDRRRAHTSPDGSHEDVVAVLGLDRVLVRHQRVTMPPRLEVFSLTKPAAREVVALQRNAAIVQTTITKQVRAHVRSDGLALDGTLYLPAGYDPESDGRLPLVLWAYPVDFAERSTAGQVRAGSNRFIRLDALSPAWFAQAGFAVLANAAMPVVGDETTRNDTYLEQIADAAAAHIDALSGDGIVDPKRVVAGGHSYGAAMVANLLWSTELFVAGIARSGCYNRTLTPLGFQTEPRTLWQAPAVYDRASALRHADRITAPLLLIHGADDSNPSTPADQSTALFGAIRGLGGRARLVVLPHEDHEIRGRESVLHVLHEQLAWARRWTASPIGQERTLSGVH